MLELLVAVAKSRELLSGCEGEGTSGGGGCGGGTTIGGTNVVLGICCTGGALKPGSGGAICGSGGIPAHGSSITIVDCDCGCELEFGVDATP